MAGLGLPGQVLIQAPQADDAAVEASLNANPHVWYFQADATIYGPQAIPNDPRFAQLAGLDNSGQSGGTVDADIDAPEAWDVTTGRSIVSVAVVDSGVDYTHPDLYLNIGINQGEIPASLRASLLDVDQDRLYTFYDLNDAQNASFISDINNNGYIDAGDLLADSRWANGQDDDLNNKTDDLIGWDFANNDNDPFDDHGHGTHVAGTIGAIGNNGLGVTGVNWRASIVPVKFLDQKNKGLTSNALSAINYATMLRAAAEQEDLGANVRVMNSSWGGGGGFDQNMRAAIDAAAVADIVFVAAAGNGNILGRGIDNDMVPFYPASYDLDNIIAVAASDQNDELATFSNYGKHSVDLAAPGIGIVSTEPGGLYATRSGTSMAAPHVSGVAALLLSHVPDATAEEVRQAILAGAESKHALRNRVSTAGRLNASQTLATDTIAPRARLVTANDITEAGGLGQQITVTYQDNKLVKFESLSQDDLVVRRTNGFGQSFDVALVWTDSQNDAPTLTVVYQMSAPGGAWDADDNGTYEIHLRDDQVTDTSGNATHGGLLGTFDVDVPNAGQIVVTSHADGHDPTMLRGAVEQANAVAGQNTIILSEGDYVLSLVGPGEDAAATGDLDVTDTLTVIGAGADKTVLDANGLDRVFDVRPGATLNLVDVAVTGGLVSGADGGAIRSAGALTITDAWIRASQADHGGAIANGGTLTIDRSLISDSIATANGGGLFNSSNATAHLTNSTFSQNTAQNSGGAIQNAADLRLLNCTVTANVANVDGGGIATTATVALANTLIAGNQANNQGPDVLGTFQSQGNNLVGAGDGSSGLTDGLKGDQIGTAAQKIDPLLGGLEDNGGPTPTHALDVASPAVNAGNNVLAPTGDQRGIPRPTQPAEGTVDVGAFERYFVEIRGRKFVDANGNGVFDANEAGLDGWTIFVDLNQNGTLDLDEPRTITRKDDPATPNVDETGLYAITGLEPGTYSVVEVQQPNFVQTLPRSMEFLDLGVATVGPGPVALAVADFDGDRFADLVVANRGGNDVSVLINNAQNAFDPAQHYAVGQQPAAVVTGDFNGDGNTDIAVANEGSQNVSLLWNDGGGLFTAAAAAVTVGPAPSALAMGDVDGDGDLDLLVADGTANTVTILSNDGSGTFATSTTLNVGHAPKSIAAADLDGDGDTDWVVANSADDGGLCGRCDRRLDDVPRVGSDGRQRRGQSRYDGEWIEHRLQHGHRHADGQLHHRLLGRRRKRQ